MIVGILLAAGRGRRFGGDKLLAELAGGKSVAETACAQLLPAVDKLIAIIRPDAPELAARLAAAGAQVAAFAEADQGMGASLAFGVALAPEADGWLIALADMPLVPAEDTKRVADALLAGAAIALPQAAGRHGHPVGFSRRFFSELTTLSGDSGARALLARHAEHIMEIQVADARVWQDVDTRDDLAAVRRILRGD